MHPNRVAEFRERAGLTQRNLAEQAGVALRTLTYIESGEKSPRVATAKAIAAVLGVSIDELFVGAAA